MRVNICNSKSGRTEQRQMSKWLSSCSGEGVVLKERVGACMIYEALLTCVLPLSLSLSLSLPFSLRPCGIIVGLLRRRRGLSCKVRSPAALARPPTQYLLFAVGLDDGPPFFTSWVQMRCSHMRLLYHMSICFFRLCT